MAETKPRQQSQLKPERVQQKLRPERIGERLKSERVLSPLKAERIQHMLGELPGREAAADNSALARTYQSLPVPARGQKATTNSPCPSQRRGERQR